MNKKFVTRFLAVCLCTAVAFTTMSVPVLADEWDEDWDGYIDDEDDWGPQDPAGVEDDTNDAAAIDRAYEEWLYEQQQEVYQDPDLSGISISDGTINVGSTTVVSVSINAHGADADKLSVEWTATNPGVASVSGSGNVATVTGYAAGTCGITATLYFNAVAVDSAYTAVNVVAKAQPQYVSVAGVSISTTSLSLNKGDTHTLSANVIPSNANNKGVSWCSSNTDVATVDGNGYVRAIGSGSAIISVRTNENGIPAYCNVTVKGSSGGASVRSVALNLNSVAMGIGQYMILTPTVYPDNASNKSVYWLSSNPAVVAVDSNGMLAAKAVGTAIVTCSTVDGGKTASATITVGTKAQNLNAGLIVTNNTLDPQVNYDTILKIQAAKKNGTVKVNATAPKSFDRNVAAYMALRKDVKIECYFPFNGHNFRLTIPKGYNLTKVLNKSGYVEWLELCKFNGVGGIVVTMLN